MPLNVNFGRVLMGEQRMTATRQSVLARWPSVPRQLVESSLRPARKCAVKPALMKQKAHSKLAEVLRPLLRFA